MNDAKPVRVALVGYGHAGRLLHAPLIRATPGLELTLVVSTRTQAWSGGDVDLAVIATPNDTHVALAAAALDAGAHVVVDKPLALSLADARALAERASRYGRMLATFQNRRWDGDFLTLTRLFQRDALGEVVHFESHFDRFRPEVRDRWREREGAGSGVWNDLGPHLVDQALQLFGVPDWVSGTLAAHRPQARTDDWAHVVLGYADRMVVLHASMLAAANAPRFVVHGLRGSWIKNGLDPQEFRLAGDLPPMTESAVLVSGDGTQTSSPIEPGDYAQFYHAIRDAVRGEGPNPVPPAQAIATTAIMEAAARSSAEGARLRPALTDEERDAVAQGTAPPRRTRS